MVCVYSVSLCDRAVLERARAHTHTHTHTMYTQMVQVKVANPQATEEELAKAVEAGGANVFADQVDMCV